MHDECDSDHLFSVQAFYEQYSEWLDKFDHIHMVFGWTAVDCNRSDRRIYWQSISEDKIQT